MNQSLFVFFGIIILIFSAVIHEIFHGLAANAMGDDTAYLAGRLTLNPLKHLDLWGSLVVPLMLYLASGGSFIFGWAKPVPYNPAKLKYQKWGPGLVAAAGPAVNLLMAVIFGMSIRFLGGDAFLSSLVQLFSFIVIINVGLALFNLVPIPPLDGSKVLFSALPLNSRTRQIEFWLERYGIIVLLLFIFFGISLLVPVIKFIFWLITGQGLVF